MISDAQIQEIKDRNRIEDVVREYVRLKPSGSGYTGLCPFHPDKNPSMSISVDKQIFKCFSCNVGGDVVHFVQKYQNVSYVEALRLLAERAGIKLDEGNAHLSKKDELRKQITLVNSEAAKFFYTQIVKAEAPRKYLAGRGITPECVKKFGIGYSPDEWSALTDFLKGKGYKEEFLEKAGLSLKGKNGGYIDKFRNRVMIPIFDVSGNVIAFGGRVMDDSKPKYINSAETDLYTKGNHLYGLNFAKRSQNKQRAIMVEGYMDCIALQNRGIDNAVASLGTALTSNQAKLIKRYFDEVVLCYDSDDAGIAATQRGISVLESAGVRVKVMSVPDGKDPDEYLRKHSPEEFEKLAENAETAIEYRIKTLERKYPSGKMDTYAQFFAGSVKVLASIEDKTTRDMYIKWFSDKYSVSKDSLTYDVNRQTGAVMKEKQKEEETNRRFEENLRERERKEEDGNETAEPCKNEGGSEQSVGSYVSETESYRGGRQLGMKLFKLEMSLPVLFSEDVRCFGRYKNEVDGDFFEFTETRRLFTKLRDAASNGAANYGFGILLDGTDEKIASMIVEMEKETELTSDIFAAADEVLKKIKVLHYDADIAEIRQKLRLPGIQESERNEYMKKINDILKAKGTLK